MSHQRSSGDLLADRRYAYAEACLSEDDPAGAAEMAEQALERAPGYAPAWFLLGRAREIVFGQSRDAADRQAALAAFGRALDLDPEDALGSRLHLAALGGGDALAAITPAYIRALFDGYAPRFERHLVDELGYCGPALMVAALDALPRPDPSCAPQHFPNGLDLGCGTGLMGRALAGRVGRLAGCDLSPAMLALAGRTRLYERLVEADLVTFLAAEPAASADLIVAADVFIYLGDLTSALSEIARVLRPGGLAAFTVQSPQPEESGVVLGADGRYAHADTYLREAAEQARLVITEMRPAAIRRQRKSNVPGRILILHKHLIGAGAMDATGQP
ncbi:methyltransferase domain-containing protein [Methylorubrum extorquens]|uniref:Methyltransferase domain-containing protein n=1 Tax=Methylorubrum extorquens TaxID=408 RepID=A0AAX3WAA6_METEX|nr:MULTISPECIES: methyltransferase domain-containing protein [Methylobacteriaceae]KQO96204.1 methyltransferase type 12 [Methylobacterium sp. Leaf92]KQQ06930.1 methyltransferase type 12 [Methylobacterium sp. Leaf122]WHQ68237.1 methyltransferase domain-containing protein [Methylorubrum extorquens]